MFFFNPALHRPAPKMFGEALRHFLINLTYVPHAHDPMRYLNEIFEPVTAAWNDLCPSDRIKFGCRNRPTIANLAVCKRAHELFLRLRARELEELPRWFQRRQRRFS